MRHSCLAWDRLPNLYPDLHVSVAAGLKYEPRAGTPLPGHLLLEKNFDGWRIRQFAVKSLGFLSTHIVTFARATSSWIGTIPIPTLLETQRLNLTVQIYILQP